MSSLLGLIHGHTSRLWNCWVSLVKEVSYGVWEVRQTPVTQVELVRSIALAVWPMALVETPSIIGGQSELI